MSDRYANLSYDSHIVIYKPTLVTLYQSDGKTVDQRWSYNPYSGDRTEKMIKKVVSINKNGVVIWEKNTKEHHSLHLRSYSKKMVFKTMLDYFTQDELKLKPNDIVGCTDEFFILDMTNKFGLGVLDIVSYKSGNLIRRFEHNNKPYHGWVVHCRSVAPPRCLRRLNLVIFLQYAFCLDLEFMKIYKKTSSEDHWPLHVESVAYNSSDIYYTHRFRKNHIMVVRMNK